MKIFCCYTQAHKTLLENYFLRSLPAGFSVTSIELDIAGPGDFLSPEFLQCISRKVDLILQSIEENPDQIVIWKETCPTFKKVHSHAIQPTLTRMADG